MRQKPRYSSDEAADEMRPENDFRGGAGGRHGARFALLPEDERLRNLRSIQQRYAERIEADTRTPDEIIGYDEHGLPT